MQNKLKLNSISIFALLSQGIIIIFGLINVYINTIYLSPTVLGLYYSLAVLALVKELLNGGVLATYLALLVKSKGIDDAKFRRYILYVSNYFFFLSPVIVLISFAYISILLKEVDFLTSILFSFTLALEVLTVWFYPTLEGLGKLKKLYLIRTVVLLVSYLIAWLVVSHYNSVMGLVSFLFVASFLKAVLAFIMFNKLIIFGISYLKQPKDFLVLAKKVRITYYANLIHKISIYPIINVTLGLEISGAFGVANSVFSSASTLSRELIRKNLKKYGLLSLKTSKSLNQVFKKDLLISNLLYISLILAAVLFITLFPEFLDIENLKLIIAVTFLYHFSYYNFGQLSHLHRINLKEPTSNFSSIFCVLSFCCIWLDNPMYFFTFLSILTLSLLLIPSLYFTKPYNK